MKIDFDPISRTMRFIKVFILVLAVSVWLESVLSDFLYSAYKISIIDFWAWGKFYVESMIGVTRPANPKMLGIFISQLTQWQNALTITVMLVFPITLSITTDWFFLWYQRTHMQSKK